MFLMQFYLQIEMLLMALDLLSSKSLSRLPLLILSIEEKIRKTTLVENVKTIINFKRRRLGFEVPLSWMKYFVPTINETS